jgi:hypothetical protein
MARWIVIAAAAMSLSACFYSGSACPTVVVPQGASVICPNGAGAVYSNGAYRCY